MKNIIDYYDRQTVLAIVLCVAALAFICGAAIASYEEPRQENGREKNETESIPHQPYLDGGGSVTVPVHLYTVSKSVVL